ncbi:MAG: DUF1565 domain-containing protein [Leptolyngbya sp. DLM2.Bin15]|nr:MAG: DUF1565 domain-containing protein [Leptolyngbya sp. DLM2.Bin15]
MLSTRLRRCSTALWMVSSSASPRPRRPIPQHLRWALLPIAAGLLSSGGAIAQPLPETAPVTLAQASSPASTHLLFVDPRLGRDSQDGLSGRSPLRTITRALELAESNSVIMLAPGVYSADSGETFPLEVNRQITLQGNPGLYGQGIVIQGSAQGSATGGDRPAATVILSEQAALVGVSVTQPQTDGYSVWVADGTPLVMNNSLSPAQSMHVAQASQPTLQNNRMVAAPRAADPTPVTTPASQTASQAAAPPSMPSVPVQPAPPPAARPVETTSPLPRVEPNHSIATSIPPVATPARPTAAPEPAAIAIPVQSPPAAVEPSNWDSPSVQLNGILSRQGSTIGYQLEETAEDAVEIPVILPQSGAAVSSLESRQDPSWTVSPGSLNPRPQQAPINIPVSPPPVQSAAPSQAAAPTRSSDVLPVPSMDIPVGNVGGLARVPVAGGTSYAAVSSGSSRAQYRVLVEASQAATRTRIQSLVPGAFSTVVNGQTMMQAGAFSDRANAQELVDLLISYGFQASLESR